MTKAGYGGHVRKENAKAEVVRSTNEGGLFIPTCYRLIDYDESGLRRTLLCLLQPVVNGEFIHKIISELRA